MGFFENLLKFGELAINQSTEPMRKEKQKLINRHASEDDLFRIVVKHTKTRTLSHPESLAAHNLLKELGYEKEEIGYKVKDML